MRSPSTDPGVTRFTLANAAWPASGRPSVSAAVAVGTLKFAARVAPGMLCIVPLTWTSTLGTVYEASALNCVRNGGSTLQYGLRAPVAEIVFSGKWVVVAELAG